MDESKLKQIKDLLAQVTSGEWAINSFIVKNGIVILGGNWPEEDDDVNMEFFAKSKEYVTFLLEELNKCKCYNEQLQSMLALHEMKADPSKSYT